MQQTCRGMRGFIKTNRNINIYMPAYLSINMKSRQLSIESYSPGKKVLVTPESLNGIVFGTIRPGDL